MMGTKRGRIDLDPDYEDVSEQQTKRQRVLEQDAKDATRTKIEHIIQCEFAGEIQQKEREIDMIDQKIHHARQMMDRLRACIVANFYCSTAQSRSNQSSAGSTQQPAIHPTVKEHLGKTPKYIPATVTCPPDIKPPVVQKDDSTSNCHDVAKPALQKLEIITESKDVTVEESTSQSANRGSRFKVKKKIIVGNVSKYIPADRREENDQSTHKWMMYVRGPKDCPHIDHFVKKVWFLLHPSYKPNDLVEVSQPPFHLTRRGWGEFPVRVQLHFKDQRNKRLDIIHLLKLDKTYTGLQTIGSETVVEVELEKDIVAEKPKVGLAAKSISKECKSVGTEQISQCKDEKTMDDSQDVIENNVTIKEHISPQKPVTPTKQDKRVNQRERTLSEVKVIPGTSGIPMSNKENCYNNSTIVFSGEVTSDTLVPCLRKLKSVQECSSSSILPSVLSKSEPSFQTTNVIADTSSGGGVSPKTKNIGNFIVKQSDSVKTVTNKHFLESHLSSSGSLTQTITGSVSNNPFAGSSSSSSSRTSSPSIGSSAVQVVLGGFGSITSSGISKSSEDKTPKLRQQTSPQKMSTPVPSGKSLLKNMYNKSMKNDSSGSGVVIKGGAANTTVSQTSSVVLQGLGSLSGTAVLGGSLKGDGSGTSAVAGVTGPSLIKGGVSSKSPAFHIVTTNRTEAMALQGQANAVLPQQDGKHRNMKISGAGVTAAETPPPQTLYVRCKDNQGNIFLVPHHLLKQVATTPQQKADSSKCTKTKTDVSSGVSISGVSPQKQSNTSVSPQKPSVKVTSSCEQSAVTPLSQNSSSSGKLSSVNSVAAAGSPAQIENNQNLNLIGSVSLQSGQSTVNQPSLFIKIEPQSPSSGNSLGKSQNMLSLKQSTPTSSTNLKKPSSVLNIKTEPVDHEYFMKNTKDLVVQDTSPSKLQTSNVLSEDIRNVSEPTGKQVTSTALSNSRSTLVIGKVNTQANSTQVQSKVTMSGQLKVTPQGLKVISGQAVSEKNEQRKSLISVCGDSNSLEKDGGGTFPSAPVATVILSGTDQTGEISNCQNNQLVLHSGDHSKTSVKSLLRKEQLPSLCVGQKSTSLLNSGMNKSCGNVFTSPSASAGSTINTSSVAMNSLLGTKSTINNLQLKNKTVLATIGSQKLLIQVPGQEQTNLTSAKNLEQRLKVTQQNKYVINDEAFNPSSTWKDDDKKIISLKKKKCYETAPVRLTPIAPINVADFPDMLSLVRAAVKRHPIISTTANLSQHPYCARSYEQWLSWNIGRRRASEWQRASWTRKFIKNHLSNEVSYKGTQLWTTKQIMVWCRLHAYSPHYMETTLHPTAVELSADSSMMGKNYSSATDSQEILPWIHDLRVLDKMEGESDDDIDIISIEPPKFKVKTEIKTEPVCCGDVVSLEPSSQARFVQDSAQKIGIKFQPCEIEQDVVGSVPEDMIFTVMKTFVGDIIRESFANKVNMGRYADGIGVGDVYKILSKFPGADFMTNIHLGKEQPEVTDSCR